MLRFVVIATVFSSTLVFAHQAPVIKPPSLQIGGPTVPNTEKVDATVLGAHAPTSNSSPSEKVIRHIEMMPGTGETIRLNNPAEQVVITNPDIADASSNDPQTLEIYARSPGTTQLIITDQTTKETYRYEVFVKPSARELADVIKKVAPSDNINIVMLPQGVLLQGEVSSAKAVADINNVSQLYFNKKGAVVSQLTTKGSKQINLHIKIAEVSRTVTNSLSVNWSGISKAGNFRYGVTEGRATTPIDPAAGFPSAGAGSSLISAGANYTSANNSLSGVIDALASEGLASILAEPNLMTRSGEAASFLVGGEYPYPVAQGGTGTTATVTIQFKEYGISLEFLPVIVNGSISLRVKTEVSSLDLENSAKDALGNLTPAIRTRRAESTVEMGNGQSMVMAGMLSDQTNAITNAFPGLSNLPILGPLFRSENFQKQRTELIIVATPYLVEPFDNPQDVSLPTHDLKFTKLVDMILSGDLVEQASTEPSEIHAINLSPSFNGAAGFNF
ncbi:MAG: type II and III secretion system protein family protein [Alphaproteobacteria bacterium]